MTIESCVAKALVDDSGVHAVCADRIYPVIAPQDITKPFIVYERLSVEEDRTQDGVSDLQMARMRFTAGGLKYADVVAADAAIRSALGGGATGDGSVDIIVSFFEQPDDSFFMESNMFTRQCYAEIQYKQTGD